MRYLILTAGLLLTSHGDAAEPLVNRLYPTAIQRCQALSYARDGARCALRRVGEHGVGFFLRLQGPGGEAAAAEITRLMNADVRDARARKGRDVLTAHATIYVRARRDGVWSDRACTTQGCDAWSPPHQQADKYFPAAAI